MQPPAVTRFAPSPTGHLHLGHAFAASVARTRARASDGRFLVRLEDIDAERCRPEFTASILADLQWLGLNWDGDVLSQSTRLPLYRACLDRLASRELLYTCFCSRAEIRASAAAPHGPDTDPVYPGTCRRLTVDERARRFAAGAPHAWRLDMERALAGVPRLTFIDEDDGEVVARPQMFGDVVLARRGVPASYHLCACHDDAHQGVTLVTRGADLRPATHLHRLLQHLMGWPVPQYAHHPLVLDAAGRRLAKRDHAVSIQSLRQAGADPQTVLSAARDAASYHHTIGSLPTG